MQKRNFYIYLSWIFINKGGVTKEYFVLTPFLPQKTNLCMGNHIIDKIQYPLFAPVVFFNFNHTAIGEVLRKAKDVLKVCTPESVYALAVITHDSYPAIVSGQMLHNLTLCVVGILVFIHQDMLYCGLELLPEVFITP